MKIRLSETDFKHYLKNFLLEQGFIDKEGDLNFSDDYDENHELVADYIRKNKIGVRAKNGPFATYELPIDAKEFFDFIGWKRYTVERVTNPDHEMYGKRYVEVSSFVM